MSTTADALPFHRTLPLVPGKRGEAVKAPPKPAPVPAVPKTAEQLAQEAAQMPVLENAGFEDGLTGWSKAAAPAFQIKTEGAAQGQKYLAVTAEKRVEAARKISGLVAGQRYTLSYQSRGNTSKDARLILRNLGSSSYIGLGRLSDTPEWKTTTLKFSAPGAEVGLELSVRSPGTFDLDDLVIKREK